MEAMTAQVLVQAQTLRGLCAEYAHGARRDAFLASVDDDIDALLGSQLRVSVIVLDDSGGKILADLGDAGPGGQVPGHAPGQAPAFGQTVLARFSSRPAAPFGQLPLGTKAQDLGISHCNVVLDAQQVLTSPVLFGQLLASTDLVVVCGRIVDTNVPLLDGLAQLSEVCAYGLQWRSGGDDKGEPAGKKAAPFRHWQVVDAALDEQGFVSTLASHVTLVLRQQMLVSASWSRLGQTADLLQKAVQTEVAGLKFRNTEMGRLRQAEDVTSSDIKEQTEPLRTALEQWSLARRDEILRGNEDGVLPFDPRLLASRLTIDNLILRQEHSAAETKYPFLKAKVFQTLVSHRYAVVPDPAAIDGIRSQMLKALDMQVRKDVDLLNQQSGELVDLLRRGAELYPAFAQALKTMRLPVLQRTSFDRLFNNITLDTNIEDSHTRLGLFKRLAEGRMFASMAFSFVTMSAGVFVLFGEPSIKRGLMKFSGVIVIVMALYFVFSMLVKGEEEKKSLEEKLEKMRDQVNQAVMRPLAKAEQGIVKTYQAFVEEVKACVTAAIDGVQKQKGLAKARVTEQRRNEDELVKGFLARRQQAASALSQKLPQFVMGLEKARQASERPTVPIASAGSAASPAGALAARVPLTPRPAPSSPVAARTASAATAAASTAPSSAAAPASVAEVAAAPARAPAAPSAPPVLSPAMQRLAAMAMARQQAPAPTQQADKAEGAS